MVKRRSRKKNKTLKRNNKSKRRTNKRYKKKMRGGMEAAAATPESPGSFLCPITKQIMVDPVIDPEGNTYEKTAIEEWLTTSQTSPMTRNRLTLQNLVENRALKDTIDLYNSGGLVLGGGGAQADVLQVDEAILERLSAEKRTTYEFWSRGGDLKKLYRVQPYQIGEDSKTTVPLWDDNGKWIRDIKENEIFILHTGPENISIKDLHPKRGVRPDCVCAKVDVIQFIERECLSGWFNLYELGYMVGVRK
jgi:hypothetical protein